MMIKKMQWEPRNSETSDVNPNTRSFVLTMIDAFKTYVDQKFAGLAIPQQGVQRKLTLPVQYGLAFIELDQIIRLESDGNYTHISLINGQTLTVCKTLKDLEGPLCGLPFMRIHKSHIINIDCVKLYLKGKGGCLQMVDDTFIPISVRKRQEFMVAVGAA